MPKIRPKAAKNLKHAAITRIPGRQAKNSPKLAGGSRRVSAEIGEIVRKRAEAEAAIANARKSHERLREAIDILPQGIVFLDADGRYILWNKKYAEIYNRSSDLFKPGARLEDTIRIGVERRGYPEAIGRAAGEVAERLAQAYQPGQRHEQLLPNRSRRLLCAARPAVWLAPRDITAPKRAEARLAFMAQHDGLTGLPNRNLLRQRMDEILQHPRRSADKVAVLVLGLDHFKAVNDTLGHGAGDKLLRAVATRLRSTLREEDALARLNSDAFAIVQSGLARPEDAVLLCKRLLEAIGDPFLLDGHSVVVGASIGIAMAPSDGGESQKLLKNSDQALSRAKNDSRGTFSFFETGMDARAQSRRKIEIDLRDAIHNDVLRPDYQPLIDLSTGRITGFDALVRWPHSERGMISPAEFIPVAGETGLINALGGLMLRRACMDAALWPDDVCVAVNLSPL